MNQERLDTLFDAWSESRLTPAEATELSALLRTDPEARARFQQAATFHGQLHAALDGLNLDQAAGPAKPIAFPARGRAMSLAASLLALGMAVTSLGWLFAAKANTSEIHAVEIADGSFELSQGVIPHGFPKNVFTWGGDRSDVVTHDGHHRQSLRFIEAEGEPNIPNSPRQSCDVFQIIDLHSVSGELLNSSEAFVELQASFLDARAQADMPIRFISKVYVFEGSPKDVAGNWPPHVDEALCSGTQFHVSKGVHPQEWKTLTTRCVLPPTAGFLVVHIGAGSAGQPGQASPKLGAQFADDIRLTLHTRQNKAELAAR
jgi:hypothetical protein